MKSSIISSLSKRSLRIIARNRAFGMETSGSGKLPHHWVELFVFWTIVMAIFARLRSMLIVYFCIFICSLYTFYTRVIHVQSLGDLN